MSEAQSEGDCQLIVRSWIRGACHRARVHATHWLHPRYRSLFFPLKGQRSGWGVSRERRCMRREQIPTRFALASKATSPFQSEVGAVHVAQARLTPKVPSPATLPAN